MYIFAEPVTEEQIQSIQSQNHEKVVAFQNKLLGLEDEVSESDQHKTETEKWAVIQAGVQEAMIKDEMSVINPSEDTDESNEAAPESQIDTERSEVFVDGPLYRNRSLDDADGNEVASATSGGEEEERDDEELKGEEVEYEPDEGTEESKERQEINSEDEELIEPEDEPGEGIEEGEERQEIENEDEELIELEDEPGKGIEEGEEQPPTDNQDEDLIEFEEERHAHSEAEGFSLDRVENSGKEIDVEDVSSESNGIEGHFVGEAELNELGTTVANDAEQNGSEGLELIEELSAPTHAEEVTHESEVEEQEFALITQGVATEDDSPEVNATQGRDHTQLENGSSDQTFSDSEIEERSASDRTAFDTTADEPFFEELDEEFKITANSEVLAMVLTIRNKVNDKYVERPNDLNSCDKWSIEYSLQQVSKPSRAWSLYCACQARRKKKLDSLEEKVDKENANYYLQNLRKLSRKGAIWRDEMDKKDQAKKAAVVGRPVPSSEESTESRE